MGKQITKDDIGKRLLVSRADKLKVFEVVVLEKSPEAGMIKLQNLLSPGCSFWIDPAGWQIIEELPSALSLLKIQEEITPSMTGLIEDIHQMSHTTNNHENLSTTDGDRVDGNQLSPDRSLLPR